MKKIIYESTLLCVDKPLRIFNSLFSRRQNGLLILMVWVDFNMVSRIHCWPRFITAFKKKQLKSTYIYYFMYHHNKTPLQIMCFSLDKYKNYRKRFQAINLSTPDELATQYQHTTNKFQVASRRSMWSFYFSL